MSPKRNGVLEAALHPIVPERVVQKQIIDLLRQLQIPFWRIGQRDARGTQDPGVPDIVCFVPWAGPSERLTVWIEVKRSDGGRLSEAQRHFGEIAADAGNPRIVAADPQTVARAIFQLRTARGITRLPSGGQATLAPGDVRALS